VFVQHFESGGTFLDLDPDKVKSYFSEQFAKGKKVVADLKPESTKLQLLNRFYMLNVRVAP